jgi:ParB/RepB/Spo0J family partition protein
MEIEFHQLDRRHERLRARRPEVERRLTASLALVGQQVPITVIAQEATFVVIDGFRRIRSLQALRRDTVEATVLDLPELEALLYHHAQRSAEGGTALEQAWLVAELADRFELSLDEQARRFGRSPSWVSRRLALARGLPELVQELVREGRIGAHAAMRSLVPLARAKLGDCSRLATAIAPLGLTSREIARIVEAWRRSPPAARERILADPRLLLAVDQQAWPRKDDCSEAASSPSPAVAPRPAPSHDRSRPTPDPRDARGPEPRSCSAAEGLLQDLDLLANLASSLAEGWPATFPQLDEGQKARAHHSLARTRERMAELCCEETT